MAAVVEQEAVAKGNAGSFVNLHGAVLTFECLATEWVRGDQSVVAGVPRGRVARILRVVEDGDTDGVSIDRPPVVHPLRGFRPDGFSFDSLAVDCGAFGDVAFQTQCRVGADRHGAFLGFVKRKRPVRSMHGDFEINVASTASLAESQLGRIRADDGFVFHPRVLAYHDCFIANHFGFDDFVVTNANASSSVPEIVAVEDVHVVERLVVRVIIFFTCHAFFHREVAGHGDAMWSDDRVEDGFRRIAVAVLGEEFTSERNGDYFIGWDVFDRNTLCLGCGFLICSGIICGCKIHDPGGGVRHAFRGIGNNLI